MININMDEKLKKLYNESIKELKKIGIDVLDIQKIGSIDIKISSRSVKRYGCCKNENPDTNYYTIIKTRRHIVKKYDVFKEHHIEISQWVTDLDDEIIKNTIIHEIIHCFPYCNNHGKEFKKYAKYINENLGYNISTSGNKKEDYAKSHLEYKEVSGDYKYKILCKNCGTIIYKKRFSVNKIKNYRCGKCGGKLEIL